MVAYSFQKRFAPLIADGSKTQTIRGHRKRHAHPGETLQLYCGMRTKACRKIIDDPICVAVCEISINFDPNLGPPLYEIIDGDKVTYGVVTDDWARADGFPSVADFEQFWVQQHMGSDPGVDSFSFDGLLIKWAPA